MTLFNIAPNACTATRTTSARSRPALGLLLLWACLLAAANGVAATASATADTDNTILVLGDSISAGRGIDIDAGWVALLHRYLQQQQPHSHYRVVNASISGETTGGGLTRLPGLLKQYKPAVVIIELGGNDGLRGFPIPRIRDNLAQLVTLCRQSGAGVLLAGMRIPPNYGSRYTRQFYDSYTLTAQKSGATLVPFLLDKIATIPALMQADGIHPTAEAQPQILQNVLPYLKKIL